MENADEKTEKFLSGSLSNSEKTIYLAAEVFEKNKKLLLSGSPLYVADNIS